MRTAGDHCPDDLLARSRTGPLSSVERRALDAHLGVCSLCRASVALGALHDEVPDLSSPDDAAVVARLAGRVVGPAGRGAPRARALAIAAGVALMTVAGVAAAWRAARRPSAPPPVSAVAFAPPRGGPGVARVARPAPAAPAVAAELEQLRAPESSPPSSVSHRRRAAAIDRGPTEAPPPDGPDRLFARANAARGAGELRAAEADYALLQSRYPASPEASVALVSAGDLLLRLGQPAAALDRFDRYLAASARGPLAPEALFGRARCLRELGMRQDEADAWRALLQRFPGSLYEGTGRRRLVELGAAGSAP